MNKQKTTDSFEKLVTIALCFTFLATFGVLTVRLIYALINGPEVKNEHPHNLYIEQCKALVLQDSEAASESKNDPQAVKIEISVGKSHAVVLCK